MYLKLPIFLNGEASVFQLPTRPDNITFGQWIDIDKPGISNVRIVEILADVPEGELLILEDKEEIESVLYDHFHLLNTNIDTWLLMIPARINVKVSGRERKIYLENKTFFSGTDNLVKAQSIIQDQINAFITIYGPDRWKPFFRPNIQACAKLLDLFLYDKLGGKNDFADFIGISKQLRLDIASALIRHFFASFPNLNQNNWPEGGCLYRG